MAHEDQNGRDRAPVQQIEDPVRSPFEVENRSRHQSIDLHIRPFVQRLILDAPRPDFAQSAAMSRRRRRPEADGLPPAFEERLRDLERALDAPLLDDLGPRRPTFRLRAPRTQELDEALATWQAVPIEGLADTFHVDTGMRDTVTHSRFADNGSLYIQNASSQVAAQLVPLPNDDSDRPPRVLDLAAAPGGKTIVLADRLNALGFDPASCLTAIEAVPARFHRLRANLERCGYKNLAAEGTRCQDGRRLPRELFDQHDAVLLDAPCSSEARIERDDPRTFAKWSLGKVRDMARKQWGLLQAGLRALRPGGECIYSTCSFAPEENEAQVAGILGRFEGEIEVLPITPPCPVATRPGLTSWKRKSWPEDVRHCLRIVPDGTFEGFFVARLRRLS